jgi:hypothetical protein
MRLIAQVIVATMLLTGIGFAKGPKYKSSKNYYGDDYRGRDRDSRYRDNDYRYRNNNYRNYNYRNYNYGNSNGSYRNLPPGIQQKLYRGGSLPPGHAKRMNRNGWHRDSYRYDRYRR